MFSEVAYKNADACRFCWMCRHLCPISLKTGKEINSARAKGLMVSMIKRGEEYDKTMAANMWECCLCGACANDCATGYDPRLYIREARSLALAEDLAPANVAAVAERMMAKGIMFEDAAVCSCVEKRISALPEKADVALVLGQVAMCKTTEIAHAAMDLMEKAGITYTVVTADTGAYLGDMIGYVDEVRKLASAFASAVAATGAKTVIALDPMDARMLKHEYKEWNIALDAEILTATSFFASLVAEGKLNVRKTEKTVSIHDAGALCRDMDEVKPVRELAAAMGLNVVEMFRHNDLAKSCGGALLMQYAPELSRKVSEGRWEDMLRMGSKVMVTEAPGSFLALGQTVPEGCELTDIVVLLAQSC